MNFNEKIIERICHFANGRKNSLLNSEYNLTPLMIRMLASVYCATKIDKQENAYLEFGRYKSSDKKTLNVLVRKGFIEIANIGEGYAKVFISKKGINVSQRAYQEMGEFKNYEESH